MITHWLTTYYWIISIWWFGNLLRQDLLFLIIWSVISWLLVDDCLMISCWMVLLCYDWEEFWWDDQLISMWGLLLRLTPLWRKTTATNYSYYWFTKLGQLTSVNNNTPIILQGKIGRIIGCKIYLHFISEILLESPRGVPRTIGSYQLI